MMIIKPDTMLLNLIQTEDDINNEVNQQRHGVQKRLTHHVANDQKERDDLFTGRQWVPDEDVVVLSLDTELEMHGDEYEAVDEGEGEGDKRDVD